MIYVLVFLLGASISASITFRLAQVFWRREMPTTQEAIEAVLQMPERATGDDLLRLMEKRLVHGAGGRSYHLEISNENTTIKMPERDHLALVIQDIPQFAAMVALMEKES